MGKMKHHRAQKLHVVKGNLAPAWKGTKKAVRVGGRATGKGIRKVWKGVFHTKSKRRR